MPTRTARTTWTGGLEDGSGTVTLVSSGLARYEVSFPKRTADSADGTTSPEELIAAAHSSCFAMQFSALLGGSAVDEDHDFFAAVVLELERRSRLDRDHALRRQLDGLGRLAEVHGQRAGEDDEDLLLHLVGVAAPTASGRVAPDART